MEIEQQIKLHSKAIRILEAIRYIQRRINRNTNFLIGKESYSKTFIDHYNNRIRIDTAIKERLENYYKKNFEL